MRAPSHQQKAKEAAVLYTSLADLGIVLLTFVYAIVLLRAVHRDQLRKFRFGIGKVEQICNLAIGAALVASGFWVAQRVVETLLWGHIAASPLGLATAAVVNAINTLINGLGWLAMATAAGSDDSAIYRAQLRARTVKLVTSLVVQAALTIAALAKDPVVSICSTGWVRLSSRASWSRSASR